MSDTWSVPIPKSGVSMSKPKGDVIAETSPLKTLPTPLTILLKTFFIGLKIFLIRIFFYDFVVFVKDYLVVDLHAITGFL